jgi:hypothetical protein
MTSGLPEVDVDLLMPDYAERMAGLARNVEDGRCVRRVELPDWAAGFGVSRMWPCP